MITLALIPNPRTPDSTTVTIEVDEKSFEEAILNRILYFRQLRANYFVHFYEQHITDFPFIE